MFQLFTIGIFILKLVFIEANKFCELETLYCEGRSHVGCNKNQIINSDANEIIKLTPYLHQQLLQNLNKFRDDLAHGLHKDVINIKVSNMNILQWNTKLELLSENASFQMKHNKFENLCYATSEYTEPALISMTIENDHTTKDINTEFINFLTTNLIKKYQLNSVLSNPSSTEIGCVVTKGDKFNSYSVACIVYGTEDIDNFKYGEPCSNCDSYECDSIYQGLCKNKRHELIQGSASTQTDGTDSTFELNDIHIYAVYVLLGGLVLLIILMLILIKYLCQYNSHISL